MVTSSAAPKCADTYVQVIVMSVIRIGGQRPGRMILDVVVLVLMGVATFKSISLYM